jgi:hypothetical protein
MLVVPHSRPPLASTMERHIEIAIPAPAGFVTKYSKIRSRSSAARSGPDPPTGTNKASSGLDSAPTKVPELVVGTGHSLYRVQDQIRHDVLQLHSSP